jgi:predicted permease
VVFLNVVLPVFLIIALGYGIRRIHFVDKIFFDKISHLAYFVAVPALLVWKIGTASFDLNFNPRLILGSYLGVLGCGAGGAKASRLHRGVLTRSANSGFSRPMRAGRNARTRRPTPKLFPSPPH